jgi:hypothetical protein
MVTADTVLAVYDDSKRAGSHLTGLRTALCATATTMWSAAPKTFISKGCDGGLFVVATGTSPDEHKGPIRPIIDGTRASSLSCKG